MSYTLNDYYKEELSILNKIFSKIKPVKQTTANKQHFCDHPDCDNNEIHKGELVYWYKPKPIYNKITKEKTYFKWRTRCINHKPISYEGLQDYR